MNKAVQAGDALHVDVITLAGLKPQLMQLRSVGTAVGGFVTVFLINLQAPESFFQATQILFHNANTFIG